MTLRWNPPWKNISHKTHLWELLGKPPTWTRYITELLFSKFTQNISEMESTK